MANVYTPVSQIDISKQEPLVSVVPVLQTPKIKIYKRRWFILAIFIFSSMINTWQWIQYAIITNIIKKYYNVGDFAVEMTSMIYMLVYIPLIFPASFLVDKWGLRLAAILGAVGTAVGSWVKVASISPDRFAVTFVGQTLLAISQTFFLSTPPKLAAVWFGANQVSTACSMGVFGIQLGVAVGFVVTPMMVGNHENVDDIGADLHVMFMVIASLSTIIMVTVLIFFKNAPPLPPTYMQKSQEVLTTSAFLKSLKKLVFNPSFNLLLLSYGINVGAYYAISTLLNQVILEYFPNGEEFAGQIGLVIVVAGMLGSVVCGIVLDKTRKFKETTLAVYILTLLGLLLFTFTLNIGSKVTVFITSGILGFFMTGYLPMGFELAVELTYPIPENTSAGLLNASAQVFGMVLTVSYSWMLGIVGDMWANLGLSSALVLGIALTAFIKSELRRQAAHKMGRQIRHRIVQRSTRET